MTIADGALPGSSNAEGMAAGDSGPVSVVIPCFNQGKYLDEALSSALGQTYPRIQAIVVNDGSTNPETLEALKAIKARRDPRLIVLDSPNQGLAAARNLGIRAASGKYILPLDADDAIGARYVERAVEVLARRPEVGMVYCLAEYFGARQGPWRLPPFSREELLCNNVIFCSALFRKQDWESAGGYCPELAHGWEDWDLWLGFIELGRTAFRLPEVHFRYRVREGSMVRSMTPESESRARKLILARHASLYADLPMRGDVPALARLFLAEGHEYPHDRSARQSLDSAPGTAGFLFPEAPLARRMKLVLPAGIGEVRLHWAKALDPSGKVHPLSLHRANGTALKNGAIRFASRRPLLFLSMPSDRPVARVEVSLEQTTAGEDGPEQGKAPGINRAATARWLMRGLAARCARLRRTGLSGIRRRS